MKPVNTPLDPGLYLVATPIGNARDITLRALDVLASADVIAAEDTRTTRKLLEIHGIALGDRMLIAYHDHSGQAGRDGIMKLIGQGKSVAYASEAGSPLVADPGFALARDVAQEGGFVTALPGATAAIAALSLSGLPSDRFCFAGFAPSAKGARQKWLAELLSIPATLIIYESPKRINRLLAELCLTEAKSRSAAICRELTKKFEEIRRGTVQELCDQIADMTLKGEIALVLGQTEAGEEEVDLEQMLGNALQDMSMKDAVAMVTQATGLPRRKVYQAALAMERGA
ncbi:16S rRNA (cytidine(1402)-2'-O)-methyltransferase [Aliiroseovarius sp. S1123]|uniref:16S rRNA (cytidine(1402)-2'-O)-methyltransferase n=1 Tax=Aliiroseovarius sp. KMU-71 TaxID=3453123 RepID=UPI001FF4DE01|nr:16S rRNA (cytidine(1402)-2'-O)-methyltransferase [Aliiroseovarius sp. S1123]